MDEGNPAELRPPALVWMSDAHGICVECNDAWLTWRGRALDEEIGTSWLEGVHPEDRAAVCTAIDDHVCHHTPFEIEFRMRRADGAFRTVLAVAVPRFDRAGEFCGLTASCTDITDDLADRRTRPDAEHLLEATLAQADHGALIGTSQGAALHRVATFIDADRHPGHLTSAHDRRSRIPLVQVASRADVFDRGRAVYERPERTGHAVGLVFIILANAGEVRARFGDWVAQEYLRTIAARIAGALRSGDEVTQIGEDEFGIVLDKVTDTPGTQIVVETLHELLARDAQVAGNTITPRLRVGFLLLDPEEDRTACLARADAALAGAGIEDAVIHLARTA